MGTRSFANRKSVRSRPETVNAGIYPLALAAALILGLLVSGGRENDGMWNLSNMSQANGVPRGVIEIIRAIDAGDLSKLKDLLEGGANPTPKGSPLSPLRAAITHFENGQLVCDDAALKLLLNHKADPNFVDQYSGFSALENALSMGDIRCATLLREAGASINQRGHSGQSTLQFAVKGALRTGDIGILKLVLSWGVDPNVLGGGDYTALHQAAWPTPGQDATPVVAELLRSGVDPCIVNKRGQRALDLAMNLESSASVQKLLADATRECPKK